MAVRLASTAERDHEIAEYRRRTGLSYAKVGAAFGLTAKGAYHACFRVGAVKERDRPGNPGVHPWGRLFDGRLWTLRRGADFDTTAKRFQDMARVAARRRDVNLHVERDGDTVFLKALFVEG